jgi:uncharacterized protein (DUF1800 family)
MNLSCRPVTFLTVATAGALLCASVGTQAWQERFAVPGAPDAVTIVHVLNRLGFGATAGDIAAVRRVGLAAYIEGQLHPERVADERMEARLSGFETLTRSTPELAREYFLPALALRRQRQGRPAQAPGSDAPDAVRMTDMRTPAALETMRAERSVLAELSQQKVLRAAYSERQLQEVLVDFWFNHFNVFAGKGPTRIYLTEYERDAIRPHVLGRFRDLLGATAHSPAMLFYLDNWQSAAPPREPGKNAQQNRPPRGLNENYARELMELHTLGVEGGYTQDDVRQVARAFTGWTIDAPRRGGAFRFDPRMHDNGEKLVLGRRIVGGGKKDGEQVLDILSEHPSTARFIATKLARRFVADVPPAPLVDRAAARFRDTRGDIREVVRTLITSPEFFASTAYRAKVKTPFEFVVSAVRATDVEMSGALPLVQALRDLGMPLYGCQPPTGYADRADAWVNTGALLGRMNFAVALTTGRLRGVRAGYTQRAGRLQEPQETLIAAALAGDMSDATRAVVAKAATASQAVALILGSPEFQKR